jgi:protein-S-isoprenylcysteine O-methyltransferase Ste14
MAVASWRAGTIDAAWFDAAEVDALLLERGPWRLIRHALSGALEPYLD